MASVGVYEAKTHLPKLLDRVAGGEVITITRHGTPVAVLRPPSEIVRPAPRTAIATIREFRARHSLGAATIRDLIDEGRR
jgi:prevent-host-death family protein